MSMLTDRRRFERFALSPMYTEIAVRTLDQQSFGYWGHAYDVSEGGAQFELDQPLAPGTPVAIQLRLPEWQDEAMAVYAFGNIIWLDDDDVNGPVRMAVAFSRFARAADRELLLSSLGTGRYRRAA